MMTQCLGAKQGVNFVINENANEILKDIKDLVENDKLGTYRMSLVNDRVLHNQIIPCLIAAKDSNTIPIAVVRLLSKMTDPYSVVFTNSPNKPPNEIYHSYLSSIKERFNDPLVTWAILKLLKSLSNSNPSPTDKNGASLKDCLSLLTNMFSIPEFQPSSTAAAVIAHLQRPSKQNGLIWNLLCQSFDSILLDLIHKRLWSEPVVEIIRLMFQNTKADVMQKLLKEWMDSASNTSSDYTYPWSSDENEEYSSPNSELSRESARDNSEIISKKIKKNSTDSGVIHQPDLLESLVREPGEESELDLDNTKMYCDPPSASEQPEYLPQPSVSKANNSQQPAANNSSSTMSDHSTMECRDIMQGNKRKVQDILANLTSGFSASTIEPSPKKRKLSGDREVGQKKRLLSRAERRKYQKDGFSSGITGSDSDSESEEEQWRVKAGDFSDPGYYSYQNQLATAKRTLEKNSQKESRDRRKRLIEIRSKTKKLKPRTLVVFQVATEEDMLEVLREFAVDFLLKGYFILLTDIHKHLIKCKENFDSAYKYKQNYAWLIYYFLPLSTQMEISIQQIPLTYEVVHYLTGETIFCILKILSSSIEVCIDEFEVIKEFVKAQRYFFETLSKYDKTEMTKVDSFHHKIILLQVVHTRSIRQLYVLLIRLTSLCGKPPSEYLSHLVVGNHVHLTTIQETLSSPSDVEFDMSSHIKQFSSIEMMRPFGQLLEKFRENSVQVNDCIFTMMHHVAGDLNCPQALDIRPIPETLQQLSTTEMQACDDWKDLIEYMINYFRFRKRNFRDASKSSLSSQSSPNNKGTQTISIKSDTKVSSSGNNDSSSGDLSNQKSPRNPQIRNSSEASSSKVDHENPPQKIEDKEGLESDALGNRVLTHTEAREGELEKESKEEGEDGNNQIIKDTKPGVQHNINKEENDGKRKAVAGMSSRGTDEKDETQQDEDSASMIAFPSPTRSSSKSSPRRSPTNNTSHVKKEVVRSLVETLRRDRQDAAISWVQESLLDAWKVRLTPLTESNMVPPSSNNQLPLEPLACYHIHRGLDIPLIAWSKEHSKILKNKVFLSLLSQLGLQVNENPTRNFPSIPSTWTANDLLELAMTLGPPANEKQYPELLGTEYAAKLVQCIMVPGQIL